ncbi:MAG TPA: twin-arginine translocation signal domain-containing protein, partial [Chloroflexota bacterium]|nr:twin-arginine translocation signal domain-containing protein [Chloroflexota bacterium]
MSLDGSSDRIPEQTAPARLSRRRFLLTSSVGVAVVALGSVACGPSTPSAPAPTAPAAGGAPAQTGPGGFSGGGTLKLLVQSHFVPAYDTWFDKWAADWGAKNKV